MVTLIEGLVLLSTKIVCFVNIFVLGNSGFGNKSIYAV